VAGETSGSDYPVTPGGYDTTYNGGGDGFISRISTTAPGYARPKAATPLFAPLVIAYKPCSAPDRMHAAPLDHASCSAPQQTSPYLTAGTPDANGAPANFVGSVRLDTCPRSDCPGSDMRIAVLLADVRCQPGVETCGAANDQSGPDYTGQLQGRLAFRMTDRRNGSSFAESGTLIDQTFLFTIACFGGTPPSVGGGCSTTTSANSILPGVITNGKRTIVALDQLTVYDGGDDGLTSTSPNRLFAIQGVFVP
jgi:hypothetical protein